MNRVIVLEGPDNLGKTYLIDILQSKITSSIPIHFGAVKNLKEAKRVMFDTLSDLQRVKDSTFLFDRSPFGDMVYGYYRKYDPYCYWSDVVKAMRICNSQFLFIVFQADPLTYTQFDIKPKGDEKKQYQKAADATMLSDRFKVMAKLLVADCENTTTMLVDCNKYDSLDHRNKIICNVVDRWLTGETLVREIE